MPHPVMTLGVDVGIGTPEDLWVLDQSQLGDTTRLGGSGPAFTWVALDCDLTEVSWEQGTSDSAPEKVVPRPDPGLATISFVDLRGDWLPGADPAVGLRPSRAIRIVDRADDTVLWSGIIERTRFVLDPADPMRSGTLECVDGITLLQRAPEVRTPRHVEASRLRVGYLIGTYRPGYAYSAAAAAVQQVAAIVEGDRLSLWQALVDAADAESGWLWVRRDGRLDLGAIGTVGGPPRTWAPPACTTVILEDVGQDLMAQPTRWDVTRRSSDETDVPVTQQTVNAAALSTYGDWQATVENHPGATDEEALQAATLAAAWWAPDRMQLGSLRVDVTAGSHDPEAAPLLLDLCRAMQLGDGINLHDIHPGAPSEAATVLGWRWTWTAMGGLAGNVTVTVTPGWGGYWSLGAVGASELSSTTRLAA